jgi:hypothetical protein
MIDYVQMRLVAWAEWKLGGCGAALATPGCYSLVGGTDGGKHETIVPINDLECCDTDAAILSLAPEFQRLITECYTRTQSMPQLVKRLGMGSEKTVYRRLDSIHVALDRAFRELHKGTRPVSWQQRFSLNLDRV